MRYRHDACYSDHDPNTPKDVSCALIYLQKAVRRNGAGDHRGEIVKRSNYVSREN